MDADRTVAQEKERQAALEAALALEMAKQERRRKWLDMLRQQGIVALPPPEDEGIFSRDTSGRPREKFSGVRG